MGLLIDGYNLLHATDLFGRGRGPGGFERARQALLNFLAESLDESQLARTTVVFDAADAPPGLPRRYAYRGLTVWFAANYDDADALIEELIQTDFSPRQLTVVSSDHRLHRAAHRRRATAIDSDRWYHQMLSVRKQRAQATALPNHDVAKPPPPAAAEVQRWMREFGLSEDEALPELPQAEGIFPPGYGDNLES